MTNLRLELLSELEQTPEQYIPELLNFVRLFRQNQIDIAIGSISSKMILNRILEEMEDAEDIADAKIALQEDGFITLGDVKKELGIN
jgi:beta-phosphoglucomutase-like phosphatase (HAD superfamily)